MRFARNVLLGALCLCTALGASAGARQRLPYDELAQSALKRGGIEGITPREFSLEPFLESGFLHTRLGVYDLYLPAGETPERGELEDYRELAITLLDVQRSWLEWIAPAAKGTRKPLADLKKARKWVEGWKVEVLQRAVEEGARETIDALKPRRATREAAERFAEFMGLGTTLPLNRATPVFEPLVLVPDRERFVELVCVGGWLYPGHRATFWQPAITSWTHCYIDRYQFLALELTDPNRSFRDWTAGVTMNFRNQRAMAQQIAQLAIGSLLDNYYESRIPPALAGALSVNLVIELFGECDTRADGDLRVRRTHAREMFVPGGQSEGGLLPPLCADSRWRDRHGADHFLSLLRQAQKDGASRVRKAKEKHLHFELWNDTGSARRVVTAPFLGPGASDVDELPEEYRGDWVEFLRAYRSGFVWWLQHEAERSLKSSGESFAALLLNLAGTEDGTELAIFFEQVYDGLPLSSEKPDQKDLEGRFLRWLSKQR